MLEGWDGTWILLLVVFNLEVAMDRAATVAVLGCECSVMCLTPHCACSIPSLLTSGMLL